MKLLAIETATEACSCALYLDGEIHGRFTVAPQKQAELILPMVDELFADTGLIPTQLDGITFGQGPGGFTGLRIACGVVQGIAFAADLPVIPISSLATLAQGIFLNYGGKQILVAFDARMGEVYWGGYELDNHGVMRLLDKEMVAVPACVSLPDTNGWYGAGSGWARYAPSLLSRLEEKLVTHYPDCYPNAEAMFPLALAAFQAGQWVSAEQALPCYLRDNVV